MASIQINRGNSQEINNTPITDGLILFNTTNKTIYMDNENARDVYSGQLSSSSDVEIVNLSDGQIIIWDETNNKWKNTDRYFDINNLTDVNLNSLANGQILKYDETSEEWINTDYTINDLSNVSINLQTLADGQIIVYNATTNKWENSEVKGGHKILNDSGTTLAQKDNLQFKGVYTQNNGDNTEVDICRTMTKAQMEALSGESLKGFINTSDEPDSLPLTAEWVAYDSNTSVKDKIEAVGTRTIFQYNGTILNSNDTVIEGIGSATIVLDNGNARIDFNARIITADSTETFTYGVNRDLFTSITGKTITPVGKGIMNFYDANGALDDLVNGYGGTCEVLNNMGKFWRPSRIYDTSGNVGGWGSPMFTQGMRIVGTVFGTYTE